MLLVGLAGALGAVSRFGLERAISARRGARFPFGTLVVNVSGSFALGLLVGLAVAHGLDPTARRVLGPGFLGAYTTFSTYAYETFTLIGTRGRRVALVYAVGSLLAGTLAAAAGLALTGGW